LRPFDALKTCPVTWLGRRKGFDEERPCLVPCGKDPTLERPIGQGLRVLHCAAAVPGERIIIYNF
jgi:hypothetical protein